jgi:hypothetical protein
VASRTRPEKVGRAQESRQKRNFEKSQPGAGPKRSEHKLEAAHQDVVLEEVDATTQDYTFSVRKGSRSRVPTSVMNLGVFGASPRAGMSKMRALRTMHHSYGAGEYKLSLTEPEHHDHMELHEIESSDSPQRSEISPEFLEAAQVLMSLEHAIPQAAQYERKVSRPLYYDPDMPRPESPEFINPGDYDTSYNMCDEQLQLL